MACTVASLRRDLPSAMAMLYINGLPEMHFPNDVFLYVDDKTIVTTGNIEQKAVTKLDLGLKLEQIVPNVKKRKQSKIASYSRHR